MSSVTSSSMWSYWCYRCAHSIASYCHRKCRSCKPKRVVYLKPCCAAASLRETSLYRYSARFDRKIGCRGKQPDPHRPIPSLSIPRHPYEADFLTALSVVYCLMSCATDIITDEFAFALTLHLGRKVCMALGLSQRGTLGIHVPNQ